MPPFSMHSFTVQPLGMPSHQITITWHVAHRTLEAIRVSVSLNDPQALSDALSSWEGTAVIASHDLAFLTGNGLP